MNKFYPHREILSQNSVNCEIIDIQNAKKIIPFEQSNYFVKKAEEKLDEIKK